MEFELSVIIPTLNEEKNIGSLIDFIDQENYTSARRWEEGGVLRTILLMHKIKLLYKLGYSPQKLKKIYRDAR
jgi:hypothetical protein